MPTLKSHLESRYLNADLYNHVYLDEKSRTVTFELWNLAGQLVGFQAYRPDAPKKDKALKASELKYFTHLTKGERKTVPMVAWGLEKLNPSQRYLFLVEGVFDAVRLHNMGLNCLAMLTCNPKQAKAWVNSMGYQVVSVCDGDSAGAKLAELSEDGISTSIARWIRLGRYGASRSSQLARWFYEKCRSFLSRSRKVGFLGFNLLLFTVDDMK